jgi:L-ascorbate metabolism protein UlaG (beta-lactamase superfamily)
MNVSYIHHSGFLVETELFYYLFDYEKGCLPEMNRDKPIFVLSSHGHADHYNPEVFSMLKAAGMRQIRAILSDEIEPPVTV